MPRKIKNNTRFSLNDFLGADMAAQSGDLFQSHDGSVFDSKEINIIHHGLDTVKQLYQGLVNQHVLLAIRHIYENKPDSLFEIDGYKWEVGSGRRGGYRYSLNSRELGVVVLFGSHISLQGITIFRQQRVMICAMRSCRKKHYGNCKGSKRNQLFSGKNNFKGCSAKATKPKA